MTQACSIYGLGLQTNVPIAGLRGLSAADRVDVSLVVGTMPPHLAEPAFASARDIFVTDESNGEGTPSIRLSRLADGSHYRFAYADGTRIVVDAEGTRVWAVGATGATVEDTATYLLGPTLGFLLRLRGITCLHASAIAIDGKAVAIVGEAGAGKSSTAAAFARLGFPIITDDVAPLRDRGTRFEIEAAYPRIRLWPDSVESLFGSPDALPRITPTWDKRFMDLNQSKSGFTHQALELAAVYVLGPRVSDREPRLEELHAKAGLLALITGSYARRCLDPSQRAQEFDVLARLVANVPLRSLGPCDDIARIAGLCDTILRDFRRLTPA